MNGSVRLSARYSQLYLKTNNGSEASIRPEDLDIVIVDTPSCSITSAAINLLTRHDVPILFTSNDNHFPSAICLDLHAPHHMIGKGIEAQAKMRESRRIEIWKAVITAKIVNYWRLSAPGTFPYSHIRAIKKAGTFSEIVAAEGAAAKEHMRILHGNGFRRKKRFDSAPGPRNTFLNYAYAILRARTATALASVGLHPSIGIYHSNAINPLALADDLMEPFRWVADDILNENIDTVLSDTGEHEFVLTPELKRIALGILRKTVYLEGKGRAFEISEATRIAASTLREVVYGRSSVEDLLGVMKCMKAK